MSQGHAANPGPAGLVALAMACFTFYAVHTGKVEATCIPLLGVWLLGGFIVQVIVGVMELNHGNVLGGNIFTFFSAFFMFATGGELIVKFLAGVYKWPALDARIDGWAWLALAIALVTWTPGYFKSPLSLLAVVLALDIAVPVVALMDLGVIGHEWHAVSGNFLLIAGIFGLYTSTGVVLNTVFERTIIPLGGPLVKPKSTATLAK
ncbi:acetate uptake transporter family protein [Desulfotruncus alcoholivorax]|uniref:acetate uptake transporter family protein n=1 Tax=Desulfotruncus alcoholivorax TaxID=265477 RepID=UPI00042519E9|nr:GPR1/FUN34/YaaH family transporter [Desulfotruncus alcoholivorax]